MVIGNGSDQAVARGVTKRLTMANSDSFWFRLVQLLGLLILPGVIAQVLETLAPASNDKDASRLAFEKRRAFTLPVSF